MKTPKDLELVDSEPKLTGSQPLPPGWDAASDFAITTINVPDRLDVLEVRAREEEQERKVESQRPPIDWDKWFKRAIALVAFLAAALALHRFALEPIERDLSANSVAKHLGETFGTPVAVAATNFDFFPNPRLVVTGIDNPGRWKLDEVSLRMNWSELWNALRAGSWTWAEATIAPLKLGDDQALALYQDLSRVRLAIPVTVTTLRFTEVQFPGNRWLPGRYEVTSRRIGTGEFGDPILTETGIDGSMRLRLIRQAADAEMTAVGFSVEAANWKAPIGPAVRWNEVTISGTAQPNLVNIQSFVLSGFYGLTQGSLVAAKDREWVVSGAARSASLNLDSITYYLATGNTVPPENTPRRSLSGSASFDLAVAGRGATLEQAVGRAVMTGPVQVRQAQLNEVNLGLAAARGGVGQGKGGITRFTELSANVVAGAAGTSLRNISARSGTMSVRGEVRVATDSKLSGSLSVDIATQRDMPAFALRVGGDAAAPQFLGPNP